MLRKFSVNKRTEKYLNAENAKPEIRSLKSDLRPLPFALLSPNVVASGEDFFDHGWTRMNTDKKVPETVDPSESVSIRG